MTSMRYCSSMCSLQIFFRLFRAANDLGVCPATYRRNSKNSDFLPGRACTFRFTDSLLPPLPERVSLYLQRLSFGCVRRLSVAGPGAFVFVFSVQRLVRAGWFCWLSR